MVVFSLRVLGRAPKMGTRPVAGGDESPLFDGPGGAAEVFRIRSTSLGPVKN
jgi:hypothetical protein